MGRLVNAVLDMAERMAKRHIPMTMEDWAKRIDIILEAGGDAVLLDAGKVTAEFARILLKPNLKSTVSFKTACLAQTSTASMTATTCYRLILTLIKNNANGKF